VDVAGTAVPVDGAGVAEQAPASKAKISPSQIDSFRDRFMVFLFYHWNSG
jgi:hypothetical protein